MSEPNLNTDPGAVKHALAVIKAQGRREALQGQPQTDIEGFTGAAEAQERREAEAGGIAADRLAALVSRIERMNEEIKALQGDVKDLFTEAKSSGFDVKALRAIIAERAAREKNADLVDEQEMLRDLYRRALGM